MNHILSLFFPIGYNRHMEMNQETIRFIKEREEKLGAPITFRTYSTWYGKVGGELREYGVFLYSDGKTLVYEDFDRNPQILGIPIHAKNKPEYIKLEYSFPLSDIKGIDQVTRSSAEKAMKTLKDISRSPSALSRFFRRLVTRVILSDGSVLFFELIDHKAFKDMVIKSRSINGSV